MQRIASHGKNEDGRRTCRSDVIGGLKETVVMIDAARLAVTSDVTSTAVVARDAGTRVLVFVALRASHDRHHRSCQQSTVLRQQEAQLLLGDRATRKHAKDS